MSSSEEYSIAFSLFSSEQRNKLPLVFQVYGDGFSELIAHFQEDIQELSSVLQEFDGEEKSLLKKIGELKDQIEVFAINVRKLANPLVPVIFFLRGKHPIENARASQKRLREIFQETITKHDYLLGLISLLKPILTELKGNYSQFDNIHTVLETLEGNFQKSAELHSDRYLMIQDQLTEIVSIESKVYWLAGWQED